MLKVMSRGCHDQLGRQARQIQFLCLPTLLPNAMAKLPSDRRKTMNALDDGEVGCLNHPQRGNVEVFRSAKYYVDEMWPLVTRMYVWGLIGTGCLLT